MNKLKAVLAFRLVNLVQLTFSMLVASTLIACGSSDPTQTGSESARDARVIGISLTADESIAKKTGIGPPNLLELDGGEWLTWSGEPTGIQYTTVSIDGTQLFLTGALLIPAPGDGRSMTVGVRRYERPLRPGFQYTFSTSSAAGGAAVLFLFDELGNLVPVPGVSGLAITSGSNAISFVAPAGVAGFYLQVQSAWEASGDEVVAPYIPEEQNSNGLIDPRRGWSDWQGNPVSGIGYNSLVGFSSIRAPEPGETMRFGVQRYPGGLVEGQQYALSNRPGTSDPGSSSLLLFMFDANGGLITINDSSWIVASSARPETERIRFTAPAGVHSFAVQFQGPYLGGSAFAYPRLEQITDE